MNPEICNFIVIGIEEKIKFYYGPFLSYKEAITFSEKFEDSYVEDLLQPKNDRKKTQ